MRRIIIAVCLALLSINRPPFVYARKSSSVIPIIGCYSDLKLLKNEGMVIGNGGFVIRKVNGRYVATFTELMHDGGEYYPDFRIRNLIVNQSKRIITFDIALHSGRDEKVLRRVTGRVTRAGIKMNWRGHHAEHGQPNPLMRRQKCRP